MDVLRFFCRVLTIPNLETQVIALFRLELKSESIENEKNNYWYHHSRYPPR